MIASPTDAIMPMIGIKNPANTPAAPSSCNEPVARRWISFMPKRLNSRIMADDTKHCSPYKRKKSAFKVIMNCEK